MTSTSQHAFPVVSNGGGSLSFQTVECKVRACRGRRLGFREAVLVMLFTVAASPFSVAQVSGAQLPDAQTSGAQAKDAASDQIRPVEESGQPSLPEFHAALLKTLDKATPLNPQETAFLNKQDGKLFLKSRVACNDCLLEMLVCPEGTKEHEAVLSYQGKAYIVHAGLLALGMKPGKPVALSPEFRPPEGPIVTMKVHWRDKDGKVKTCDARDWMRTSVAHYYSAPMETPPEGIKFPFLELRYDPYNKEILWFGNMTESDRKALLAKSKEEAYQKIVKDFFKRSQYRPMTADFVFTGSFEAQRVKDGPKFYAAEDGYLVCVANFVAATIDVKEASSASDGDRSYEANSDKVPPRGTPVILEMTPAKK